MTKDALSDFVQAWDEANADAKLRKPVLDRSLPRWLNTEPMVTVLDALRTMNEALYVRTGRASIKALVLDEDGALGLGIVPGQVLTIATAEGRVEIRSERRVKP